MQRIEGPAGTQWFGTNIAGAGDIDNDGFADLVAGSPDFDGVGSNRGRLYFFLSDGDWLDPIAATIDPDWSDVDDDQFGIALATGGAGLGGADDYSVGHAESSAVIGDVLAGARNGIAGHGNILILFGDATSIDSGVALTSSEVADDLGTPESQDGRGVIIESTDLLTINLRLSYAGDLNNDGYEDFVVSDTTYDPSDGGNNNGVVAVYY